MVGQHAKVSMHEAFPEALARAGWRENTEAAKPLGSDKYPHTIIFIRSGAYATSMLEFLREEYKFNFA